jgi:hypothetical protein
MFMPPFTKPKKNDFRAFGTRFAGGFYTAQIKMIKEKIAKELGASILRMHFTVLDNQLMPDTSFWNGGKLRGLRLTVRLHRVGRQQGAGKAERACRSWRYRRSGQHHQRRPKTVDTSKNVALVGR